MSKKPKQTIKSRPDAAEMPRKFGNLYEKLSATNDIDVHLDEVHDIATIYTYCNYDEYRKILDGVFIMGDNPDCHEAMGQTSRGAWKDNQFVTVVVVWINSVAPKDETMSTMIHEMSHMADFILDACKISDGNGEARAYIMEAESRRVFKSMYGMNEKTAVNLDKIVADLSKIKVESDQKSKETCRDA